MSHIIKNRIGGRGRLKPVKISYCECRSCLLLKVKEQLFISKAEMILIMIVCIFGLGAIFGSMING